MAKLIYSAIMSLDGYVADVDGNFDWAVPDEEAHTFIKRPPPKPWARASPANSADHRATRKSSAVTRRTGPS